MLETALKIQAEIPLELLMEWREQADNNHDVAGFDGYNGDLTGDKAATLGVNCGMSTGRNGVVSPPIAFACNQRLSDKSDKRCNVLKSDCSLNIEKPP